MILSNLSDVTLSHEAISVLNIESVVTDIDTWLWPKDKNGTLFAWNVFAGEGFVLRKSGVSVAERHVIGGANRLGLVVADQPRQDYLRHELPTFVAQCSVELYRRLHWLEWE